MTALSQISAHGMTARLSSVGRLQVAGISEDTKALVSSLRLALLLELAPDAFDGPAFSLWLDQVYLSAKGKLPDIVAMVYQVNRLFCEGDLGKVQRWCNVVSGTLEGEELMAAVAEIFGVSLPVGKPGGSK